jgi:putative FmdB family regulatory protein
MPIYEYLCDACGHAFEKIQKVTDSPIKKCPACGRLKTRRLISQSAFVLKGDGWYVTDYPSKDRKKSMEAEKKSEGAKVGEGAKKASGDKKGKAEKKGSVKSNKSKEST